MARTSDQVAADIRRIDRRIDGVRLELFRRGGCFNTLSANEWQFAWDRHPDLYARHSALYGERGILQVDRDAALEREYRTSIRQQRRSRRAA